MVARGKRHRAMCNALWSAPALPDIARLLAGADLVFVPPLKEQSILNLGMPSSTEWNVRIHLCSMVQATAAITIAG
jgi:hypothetical protein